MTRVARRAAPEPAVQHQGVMEIYEGDQGDEEWAAMRRGIPTASKFATIMAIGDDGEDSIGRAKLMNVLAGEIITGETAESYHNKDMDRGVEHEPVARTYYARTTFYDVRQVAFVKRIIKNPLMEKPLVVGCSPDGLIQEDGGLEIKVTRADLLIPILRKGAAGLPAKYRAQCQGSMWVTARAWWDLLIFCRGMPAAKFRLMRDEVYIQRIRNEVEKFDFELHRLVKEIQALRPR